MEELAYSNLHTDNVRYKSSMQIFVSAPSRKKDSVGCYCDWVFIFILKTSTLPFPIMKGPQGGLQIYLYCVTEWRGVHTFSFTTQRLGKPGYMSERVSLV